MKPNRKVIAFYTVVIAATTIIKVVCAPQLALSGTTGIMAVALFAGLVTMTKKQAFLLPLITLLVSNLIIEILFRLKLFGFAGFYNWQAVEYSLLGFVLTGIGMAFRKLQTTGIFISAFVGPTVFFLISNFIVWLGSRQIMGYTTDFKGIMDCYIAGLPFYRNSIISTVILLPVFIVSYQSFVQGKRLFSLAL